MNHCAHPVTKELKCLNVNYNFLSGIFLPCISTLSQLNQQHTSSSLVYFSDFASKDVILPPIMKLSGNLYENPEITKKQEYSVKFD